MIKVTRGITTIYQYTIDELPLYVQGVFHNYIPKCYFIPRPILSKSDGHWNPISWLDMCITCKIPQGHINKIKKALLPFILSGELQ
jgi:hypothetical protein